MQEAIVRIEHLSHRYNVQWAIRDINFEIDRKGIVGLLGSNGAGKSTTMNIICGALNQTQGKVTLNGVDLKKNPEKAKQNIGFLPQKPPLYPELTVDEYLSYCAYLRLLDKKHIKRAVEIAKDKCGITHFSKRLIRNLSGGYQQRVGIAQAIVHSPKFVVLDEPTNGLDPNQIIEIRHLIKEIALERAVLLSTHILPEVQATCDYIRMIELGQLVFSGTMDEFQNYVKSDTLVVTLDNPPLKDELFEIPGIIGVEQKEEKQYRLHFNTSPEVAERIIDYCIAKDWHLREIFLEKSSLDTIFAKLSNNKLIENID